MTEGIEPCERASLTNLEEWDASWAAACKAVSTSPWRNGVLPRRFVELVSLAINIACTNLNAEGTRRHIRGGLDAGASRDEILFVIKCATAMAIHSCSLGAPILLEEAKAAGLAPKPTPPVATPACDRMKAMGPAFTAAASCRRRRSSSSASRSTPSFTHMYAPGTRRHIKNALTAGASVEEIFEVLKLCVAQGAQAINLGIPILEEELARTSVP